MLATLYVLSPLSFGIYNFSFVIEMQKKKYSDIVKFNLVVGQKKFENPCCTEYEQDIHTSM